jgi:hypothetical protein
VVKFKNFGAQDATQAFSVGILYRNLEYFFDKTTFVISLYIESLAGRHSLEKSTVTSIVGTER